MAAAAREAGETAPAAAVRGWVVEGTGAWAARGWGAGAGSGWAAAAAGGVAAAGAAAAAPVQPGDRGGGGA